MASLARKAPSRPPQKIVLVAANKGGVGKTTIAINLAVAAATGGERVCAIDFDAQHSLDYWHLKRKRFPNLPQVPVFQGRMEAYKILLGHAADYDLVFVDTPPNVVNHVDAFNDLIDLADFIIVPTCTGSFDLQAVGSWMQEQLKTAKGHKVAFVLNRIKQRSTSYAAAYDHLNKKGRICGVPVRDLTSIEQNMIFGGSVMDLVSDDKGKDDFSGLYTWLCQELER